MIIGEAWGSKEAEQGKPFVGASGYLLDQLLSQNGLDRRECYVTNVFNFQPHRNEIETLCGPKALGIPGMPELRKGKYISAEYTHELRRLYREIINERPNVILALGATASWATIQASGIKAVRGAVAPSATPPSALLPDGTSADDLRLPKVVPSYHPAAVLRDMTLRPILAADIHKTARESRFPEIRRPRREIWLSPTLLDLARFEQLYMKESSLVSADIETKGNQITCFGFAPRNDVCVVIPFLLEDGRSYWPTKDEELQAWGYVRRWLAEYPTLFQNGMYDMSFSWRSYGLPTPKASEDTMLLHHAFQPEMEKGLGFLATIYSEEASWKFMRKGKAHD